MEKNRQPARFLLLAVPFFLSLTDLLVILFILLILVFPFSTPHTPILVPYLIAPSLFFPLSLPSNRFSSFRRLCQSRSVFTLLFFLLCPRLLLFALPLPAFIAVTVNSSRCHGEDPIFPAMRQLPWQRHKQ